MSIYKRFCKETVDENGRLLDIEFNYPNNFNFGYDVVDKIAEETPDKKAMVWCNTENEEHIFSFADISLMSNKVASVLLDGGIKRGDKVIVALKRHYEYWFLAVALHKIGAVMIPVTHMLTADDFIYRLDASKAVAVIATPFNDVPKHVTEAVARGGYNLKLWTVQQDIPGLRNLTKEMEAASPLAKRIETVVTDPMVLYFTSGTTGYPKGVMHDFSYPLAHIVTAAYWQQAEDNGLHFTVSETGWAKASWGKIYGQWLVGSAVMVFDFDNFDPRQLATVINRYGVTSFCAPPTIYRYLVKKGVPEMPSLRHTATAGEYLNPEIFRLFKEKTGLELHEGYGQTETTLLAANFKGMKAVDDSLGVSSPQYDVRLIAKDGSIPKPGEIGEIVVVPRDGKKPIGIFTAYLGNDEMYKEVWRDGVYHTGDSAWLDENGAFWFNGRFDDIIKSGGFRIGPGEIEDILITHPAVMECSVIGVPDPLRGQAIKAIIVLAEGYEPSHKLDKEIKDYCNSRLADYKWIRIVEFTEAMPKTISGKIRKAEQRKAAEN